ncbi:MAG: hypothetical protein DRO16_04960 [Thermoprotei archaeon]|nr:MAG: hypothetical protein DRO16_04960 [Thermoprotei archaeon]
MLIRIWFKSQNHSTNITCSKDKGTKIISKLITKELDFEVVTYQEFNPNKIDIRGYVSHRNIKYLPTDTKVISEKLTTI